LAPPKMVAWPAVELLKNCKKLVKSPVPIVAPPAVELPEKNIPQLISSEMVAWPAVDLFENCMMPSSLKIAALPAVDLFENCIKPSLLKMVALPAADVSLKNISPPVPVPEPVDALVNTSLPAVALFENTIVPALPEASTAVTKFCVTPELFVMPVPLMVSVKLGLTVMVYAEAAEVNVMPLTSVFAEIETLLVFERSNVAVSDVPLGTIVGVQLAAVFQSSEPGLRSQVALPAWLAWMKSIKINAPKIPVM
jgi:hypothetical protein